MNNLVFLLDTNVVIGLLNNRQAATALVGDAKLVCLAISQITRIELLSFHALGIEAEAQVHRFVRTVKVIELDDQIEAATIALRRRARLKLPDSIIGATAQVHGLTLLTLDERLKAALVV
jgi:predicted nucleic acid-binding protein